jgi:ketosteroid isomerase-like protein
MKKLVLLTLVCAFALSACGGVKATVSNDPYAKESQAIVEKWIAAYQKRDAQTLLSLYANGITWRVCSGTTCDSYGLSSLTYEVPQTFKHQNFKVEIQSYLVTNLGEFATVQGTYADPEGDARTPTPATVILEIRDGKILNETWYCITF